MATESGLREPPFSTYIPDPLLYSFDLILGKATGRVLFGVVYSISVLQFALYLNTSAFQGRSFDVDPIQPWFLVVFVGIAALPAAWSLTPPQRPSFVLYQFLYLLVYVPAIIIPSHHFGEPMTFLPISVCIFVGVTLIRTAYSKSLIVFQNNVDVWDLSWWYVVALTGGLMAVVQFTAGFSLRTLVLGDPHAARAVFKGQLASQSALVERISMYSTMWLKNVLFPMFLAVGIWQRRIGYALLGASGLGLVFTTGGYRSAIFIAVILGTLVVLLQERDLFPTIISFGLLASIWSSIAVNHLFGVHQPAALLRRLLLSQGMHVGTYYDYFSKSDNPFVYLSNRPFVPWLEYPYEMGVPGLIGSEYYPIGNIHANANLWADGYAMFGFLGVILFSLALLAMFYAYDCLSHTLRMELSVLFLSGQILIVVNTTIVNTLFTHGFAVLLMTVGVLSLSSD